MRLQSYCWMAVAVLAATTPGHSQEKVSIRLVPRPNQRAVYDHKFEMRFYSDRAEYVRKGGAETGSVRIFYSGEWRSVEEAKPYESPADSVASPDTLAVFATIEKADSRAVLDDEKLSFEKFPHTLDRLNGRTFKWMVAPDGTALSFTPEFRKWSLDREDMITEVGLLWLPETLLAVPEHPVGEGDSWAGIQSFSLYFNSLFLQGQSNDLEQECRYRIKRLKKEGKSLVADIEEERTIRHYKGWLHAEEVSQVLEGAGKCTGKWKIDVTRGIVLEHEMRMDVDRPVLTPPGDKTPLHDVRAEFQVIFQRKLQEIKEI